MSTMTLEQVRMQIAALGYNETRARWLETIDAHLTQLAQAVGVQQWQFRQRTDEGWGEWQNIAPQHVDTVERRSDCEVRGLGVITAALPNANGKEDTPNAAR